MGCFRGCFGSSKENKRRKQRGKVIPRDQKHGSPKPLQIAGSSEQGNVEPTSSLLELSPKPLQTIESLEQDKVEKTTDSGSELRDKSDEQLSFSKRKKVTFDSNVQTYEHVPVDESTDSLLDNNKVSEKEKKESQKSNQSNSEDDSITSSVGSYPPNHRYQNCQDSDSEVEELENEDSDLDEEDDDEGQEEDSDYDEDSDGRILCPEVWSESIQTASVELRSRTSTISRDLPEQDMKTIGLSRKARDRSGYVYPVLNPVENLTQWKAVKSKGGQPLQQQKENFSDQEAPRMSFSSEPIFKQSHKPTNLNREISVDTSLSNWLVSSETTPKKKASSFGIETITSEKSTSPRSISSPWSLEDRPILGALTVEELRQFSATSSPRKSPSRSPDDMPIIGSVGSYWSEGVPVRGSGSASSFKGIPNTTSKYREDKRVNWHTTPFQTRLERALNRVDAEA